MSTNVVARFDDEDVCCDGEWEIHTKKRMIEEPNTFSQPTILTKYLTEVPGSNPASQ